MCSDPAPARRAGVLGQPVLHSLSPVIHNAGYAAAGLDGWAYTAVECGREELPGLLPGLDPEWVGLSLTMPLKEVAPGLAVSVTPIVEAIGAANTLVRHPEGWHAENTDAPGMVDALRAVGLTGAGSVAVLGAGGTARAALGAARALGACTVTAYTRRPGAGQGLLAAADRLGVPLTLLPWRRAGECVAADVAISTVPKGVADHLATAGWRPPGVVFDVVYDPWPTPLAAAAGAAGCTVLSGLELLLAQAVRQFELFTGVSAPVTAMRAALDAARGRRTRPRG